MLAFRLGLGPVVGRYFLVLTTKGKKSGLPRHTMVLYQQLEGRRYVTAAYGARSHWYVNLGADPRVTVQTASGTESMRARTVVDSGEVSRVLERLRQRPLLRRAYQASRGPRGADGATAADALWVTFDATSETTPPRLRPDLLWAWAIVVAAALVVRGASKTSARG